MVKGGYMVKGICVAKGGMHGKEACLVGGMHDRRGHVKSLVLI